MAPASFSLLHSMARSQWISDLVEFRGLVRDPKGSVL